MDEDAEGVFGVDEGFAPDVAFEGDAVGVGVTVGDAPAAAFQFGDGGVQVVHFEGDVMHARPAVLFQEAGHGAVFAGGLQQFHATLADVERAVADAHIFNVFFGVEDRSEPLLEERLRGVQVFHGQGDALDALDEGGHAPSCNTARSAWMKPRFSSGVPTLTRRPFGSPKPPMARTM